MSKFTSKRILKTRRNEVDFQMRKDRSYHTGRDFKSLLKRSPLDVGNTGNVFEEKYPHEDAPQGDIDVTLPKSK